MLRDLLEQKGLFKLVCGAGNEDAEEVEKLVFLYAKAGCKLFDLSAKPEIVDAAKRGLKRADVDDAYLCVSVGIKGDPHISKAQIDYEKCVGCGKCDEICSSRAIVYHKVKTTRCIGCGKCAKVCSKGAISYISENKNLNEIIPPILDKGVDCIELHAMGENDDEIIEKWEYINFVFDGILSICTARGKLSDEKMVSRIKTLTSVRKPYSTIIQTDGYPMSGGCDDYKTTLQAVATAEIVLNENLPVYIVLSGGTNSKSMELAKLCGLDIHGVAIGSYARKIVSKYIDRDDFFNNKQIFNDALELAKNLVNSAK